MRNSLEQTPIHEALEQDPPQRVAFVDRACSGDGAVQSEVECLLAANVDPRQLLGRAIAYDIGHVLLNTNSHGQRGLMRALWSQAELRRNMVNEWRLEDGEAQSIRAALLGRADEAG